MRRFGTSKLWCPMLVQAAIRSKAVVLLLLIHCLLVLPLFVGVLCWVLHLLFSTLAPSSFAIILMGMKEVVALLYLSSWCLVAVSVMWLFPNGAMGLCAVSDCGISWSFSLILFRLHLTWWQSIPGLWSVYDNNVRSLTQYTPQWPRLRGEATKMYHIAQKWT